MCCCDVLSCEASRIKQSDLTVRFTLGFLPYEYLSNLGVDIILSDELLSKCMLNLTVSENW